MLNNIDTKALAMVFSDKKFLRSVDGNKEKYKNYLVDLISSFEDLDIEAFREEDLNTEREAVVLPKEIIPNMVTLDTFAFTYEKDPSTLPILLRYFTHKNLLKEAKDDLDKINQELQSVMDKDLEDLQDRKAELQEDKTSLNSVKMHSKEAKEFATDINKQITETPSKIKEIESHKENIKNFLNGEEVIIKDYQQKYYLILKEELTKVMEEKLAAYVKDNTDIEKAYQILNSKAKKIISSRIEKQVMMDPSMVEVAMFLPFLGILGLANIGFAIIVGFIFLIPFLLAVAVFLRNPEQSFVKEMQGFIEGSKHIDQATNTEESKEEPVVGNLIDFSDDGRKYSTLPYKRLYPDLSEELLALSRNKKDSEPSSNLDSPLPPSNNNSSYRSNG